MKKERNSSIEMLRILAMLGIVIMHTNGAVMEHGSGTGFAWTQIENGIFNAGVSIFVLISGYFGIRRSTQKLIVGIDSDSLCGFKRISGMLLWQSVYIKHNQSFYSCFNELLLVYFLLHIIDDLLPIYQ